MPMRLMRELPWPKRSCAKGSSSQSSGGTGLKSAKRFAAEKLGRDPVGRHVLRGQEREVGEGDDGTPFEVGDAGQDADDAGNDQLYEQIEKLARKGLSARQISEDLKTPLGEVELVLSLRSNLEN